METEGEKEDCARGMEQQTARTMEMRKRREEEENERFEGCLVLEGEMMNEEEEEEREEKEKEDGEGDGKDKGAGADGMGGKEEEDPAKGGKTENEDIIVVLGWDMAIGLFNGEREKRKKKIKQ